MENNEKDSNIRASIPEKSQLPIGFHLFLAVIFLIGAIIYTISPIDFIPDVLGPIGWVDDIMIWVVTIFVDLSIIRKSSSRKSREHQDSSGHKESFI